MIPEQINFALGHRQVDALLRTGAVIDDVTQAVDVVNPLRPDILENGFECFLVGMNVRDDGDHEMFFCRGRYVNLSKKEIIKTMF